MDVEGELLEMESLRMKPVLFLFIGRQSVPKFCESHAVGSMTNRSCEKCLVYLCVTSGHERAVSLVVWRIICVGACCYVEIPYP